MSQFIELVNVYMNNICLIEDSDGHNQISGSIDTQETYADFINELKALDFSFSTRSCTSNPNREKLKGIRGQICFESKRVGCQFFGSPFIVERKFYLHCSFGKKYYGDRYKEKVEQNSVEKQRRKSKPSKKIGCPAKMSVKQVRIFTDFIMQENNWRNKKAILQALKKKMDSDTPPKSMLRFFIVVSSEECHSHPIVPTKVHHKLHPDLISEIHNLVQNSVCSVPLIKSHLLDYVKAMFLNSDVKPDSSNGAYFPSNKIIYNHMRKALSNIKDKCVDEDVYNDCSEQWVEIISSSEPVDQHGTVIINGDEQSEKNADATVVFELVDVTESNELVHLQQLCKEELSKIETVLDRCQDKDYVQALLNSLKDLAACTVENVSQIK